MKQYELKAKLTAMGGPAANLTAVMSGQVDVGWAAPPFGLDQLDKGDIRVVATGNDAGAELLAREGLAWRAAANVAMNQPDFLPENAPALAKILQANVTREALQSAFAASATTIISAVDYVGQTAVSDEAALEPALDAVLAANPQQVETYRGGKEGVLGFLVGQVMKETQGKADPKVVNRLLREKLKR